MKEISDVLMEMMTREEIGIVYKKIVRPSLLKFFHGDPEPLHNVFLNSLHYLGGWRELVQTIERLSVFKDEALEQKSGDLTFQIHLLLPTDLTRMVGLFSESQFWEQDFI